MSDLANLGGLTVCETCGTAVPDAETEWHEGCGCGFICSDVDACNERWDAHEAADKAIAP